MATQGQQHQAEMDDPFASLSPYEFALLTTFRTSGVGVPTAMWFAYEHGKLYMVTGRSTGKLKPLSPALLIRGGSKQGVRGAGSPREATQKEGNSSLQGG